MKFSKECISKLGYYVYRLVDPRNGQTFYVGKGYGNRVYDHVSSANKSAKEFYETFGTDKENKLLRSTDKDAEYYAKLSRIRDIQSDGLEVIHIIQRYGMNEKTAFEVEAALIDLYGLDMLTNEINGHHGERGMFYTEKLKQILETKEYEDIDKYKPYMIIKVTQSSLDYNDGNRYEATRKWWKNIDPAKANKCKYILSVTDSIVRAVYVNPIWDKNTNEENRRAFIATECKDINVLKHFLDKKIPSQKYIKRGQANPCLYSK